MDWIDEEKERRDRGITRGLNQSQHAAVNSKYPGCTLEYCCECDEPTGRAGRYDDSLFTDDGDGPYCEYCFPEWECEGCGSYTKRTGDYRTPTYCDKCKEADDE